MSKTENGTVVWTDLTVPNASEVKDFYTAVFGCNSEAISMGDYDDFTLTLPDSGKAIAGVCHARGGNSDIPSQWMMYFKVSDIDEAIENVKGLGGKTITPLKQYGDANRYVLIQDPAGAVCALFEDK